jgi:hypothetical protein
MGDFFAQELPVTLAQPMERLVHGVLSHPDFIGNLRLRRVAGLICEQGFQALEQGHVSDGSIFIT